MGLLALLVRRRKAASHARDAESAIRAVMASGILSGRIAARELGRDSLSSLGVLPILDFGARARDIQRAQSIARGHAAFVAQAERELRRLDTPRPMAAALDATEYRLRTIAATETFTAVNEERLRAARELHTVTGILMEREWNAMFDACPACRDMDGVTVGINQSFPGGLEPGGAHPSCRCWLEIYPANRLAA